MKADPRLHHTCINVSRGNLELVVEMFELFNCHIVYRPPQADNWAMVGQEQLRFAIQIAEVGDKPIADIDIKKRAHIAFISDDPQKLLDKVKVWAGKKGVNFREGGWSSVEKYFDLPDTFVNFVIEIMHSSIEKE
ncbi:MAG TPA: hypothetical protein VFT82_01720 [Candidatus Paceibacterota bacterium]|nr:hypothetical protein [Candidatus Paceibacterota bacterium]